MKGRMFWVVAAVLLAGIVHLSFILFMPGVELKGRISALKKFAGTNTLVVLARKDTGLLMEQADPSLVHAVCIFDMRKGNLAIEAKIPASYWSMSMYSLRGDSFYTLNDTQAKLSKISIVVAPPEQNRDENALPPDDKKNDTIKVTYDKPDGIVVLRALAAGAVARRQITRVLGQSTCRIIPPGT